MNSAGVRYLLVGGYAVNRYGHHRSTQDIDFWIATDEANSVSVADALRRFGFASPPSPAELRDPKKVHRFGLPPVRIDLLTHPSGVDFEACFGRRRVVEMDGVAVSLISLDDLRANKLASGRPKDLIDVESLADADPNR